MSDEPKRRDTIPCLAAVRLTDRELAELVNTSPPPALTDAMREAAYGPQDDDSKERPTKEVCPLCAGEGLVTPTVGTEYRHAHGERAIDLVGTPGIDEDEPR